MNRFILRHPITGETIGRRHATQGLAERAARRKSMDPAYTESAWCDDIGVQVWWLDDTGKPKMQVGYAWRGSMRRNT